MQILRRKSSIAIPVISISESQLLLVFRRIDLLCCLQEEQGLSHVLPITELLVCAGFFLIYLAEEVAHLLLSPKHRPDEPDAVAGHSLRLPRQETHSLRHEAGSPSYGSFVGKEGDAALDLGANASSILPKSPSPMTQGGLPVFRCIMIVFALSFHSIFDGLAIGLQDTTTHTLQLLFAICIHKLLIAFVVGLDVYSETDSVKKVLAYMLPFALMSPLGLMAAAFAAISLPESVVGILTALSAGSLLYIAFFEILFRERKDSRLPGLLQLLAVASGFSLMAVLQALTEH